MAKAAVIQSLGYSIVPVIITIVGVSQQMGFEPCPCATLQNRGGGLGNSTCVYNHDGTILCSIESTYKKTFN